MSLISPLPGAYAVVTLDPVASLGAPDDPIVQEECQRMQCGKYIACITKVRLDLDYDLVVSYKAQPSNSMDMLLPQCTFQLDFVVQGLPPDNPSTFYHHTMSVSISPNTTHPTGRRILEAFPPLPWQNCYHALPFQLKCRCAVQISYEYPQSCLTFREAAVLRGFMDNDDNHVFLQEQARDAGAPLSVSPAPEISPDLQMQSELADDVPPSTEPWWRSITKKTANEAQTNSPPASRRSSAEPAAETEEDNSDVRDVMEAFAVQFSNPSVQPLGFEAPPHASGFLTEIAELQRIKSDYHARLKARRAQVERDDANYIASIEAKGHSVEGRPQTHTRGFARCFQCAKDVGASSHASMFVTGIDDSSG
ncbi:hypothetical protein HDZ31DRAFT_37213 [Schizophyllum fasciatum]